MYWLIIGIVILIAIILLLYREFWMDNGSSLWADPICKNDIPKNTVENQKKENDEVTEKKSDRIFYE